MANRFLELEHFVKTRARKQGRSRVQPERVARASSRLARTRASCSRYVRPMAVQGRALVILIENGGIDLGIPELVDKVLSAIPGSSLIPDSFRRDLVEQIRAKIKSFTDQLIETAELSINRYSAAAPSLFGEVIVLRDGTASCDELKGTLITLSRAGKVVDLFILTHGSGDYISVPGGINSQKIRDMKAEYGKPLSIRSVYMMNCVGSSLNQAWLDAGAKVSSGAIRNNYLPEPSMFFFWQNWKQGQSFENAVTGAYRRTIHVMNEAVRALIRGISLPGAGSLADLVDFENMDFVRDSAPVIQGQRSITINSDDLVFGQSLSSALATTVLPVGLLRSLGMSQAASAGQATEVVHSYRFHSPSQVMAQSWDYSIAQNPGVVIAGVTVGDAAQVGLAAIGVAQAQGAASQGKFSLAYEKAYRLLTNEARNKMPGAQQTKKSYSCRLFYLSIGAINAAKADVIIEWEGNPYGEIGTPVIQRKLATSTDWSRSSANISITRYEGIPLPNTDPRTWPIVYTYIGDYDPYGNGHFEFSGEFEINAFGGLKFNRHEVVSRSMLDFAIAGTPEDKVRKGPDVIVPVPAIPQEQIDYLRNRLP